LHVIEYRVRAADGRWRGVHDRAGVARDDQGRPVAWHGVLLDVSEQRRLAESLRVSEARFRSTFEGPASA
jgi:PAS domain-containing protein